MTENFAPDRAGTSAPTRPMWALALLCVTTFMIILDTATVTTALPSIQNDLSMAPATAQWVITAYTVAFGSLMLLGGRLADFFGRRRVFMAGIVIFMVASLVCGLAVSGEWLIGGRILQGAGGAVVMPAGLSILMTLFPEGPERNRALGAWSATASGGAIVGFVVGGPLTDGPGWSWIFYMNLPMGVIMFALTPLLLPAVRAAARRPRLDVLGAVTITGALATFVAGIATAPEVGWSNPRTFMLLAASATLFAAFMLVESKVLEPLIPLRLFRSRWMAGVNLVMITVGMVAAGMPYVLTLYTQRVLDWSASQFALMMLPFAVTQIGGFVAGQRLASRSGAPRAIVIGLTVSAVGILPLVGLSVDGLAIGWFLLATVIYGVGFGVGALAAQVAALAGSAPQDAGLVGGLSEATPMLGQPLGIAVLAGVAGTRTDYLSGGGGSALMAEVAGYRAAMVAAIVITVLGALSAVVLLRERNSWPQSDVSHNARGPEPSSPVHMASLNDD